jgi:hypothetical protein
VWCRDELTLAKAEQKIILPVTDSTTHGYSSDTLSNGSLTALSYPITYL